MHAVTSKHYPSRLFNPPLLSRTTWWIEHEEVGIDDLDYHSASAYSAGYPAAYVCDENIRDSSPYIHSAQDTVSTVSFPHVLQHAKVSLIRAR